MRYKKYFRKTSFKQKGVGEFFLDQVRQKKPKSFLEIGVFHGVTARNVCELLYQLHGSNFKYVGIDLFEESSENENEIIPSTTFKNPIKHFYFKYIKRQNPYNLEAVNDLLKKFKNNVHLIKGNSNIILKKIDMKKIDFALIDGGHYYDTVKSDLNYSKDIILENGTVICDDYDLERAPGVKKAIDEFVEENSFQKKILLNNRFAIIEK